MKNYVNLKIEGDWKFYGINPLGATITIIPKKVKIIEGGYYKMTFNVINDDSKVKIVFSSEEYQLLFGGYTDVIKQKFTLDFDIELHDGGEPDTIINYIEKV